MLDKENSYVSAISKKGACEEVSYKKTVLGESMQKHTY